MIKFKELFESTFGDYIYEYNGDEDEISFAEVKKKYPKLPAGLKWVSAKHGYFITGDRELDLSKFKNMIKSQGSK